MTIGEKIKELRTVKGWSQQELADKAGIHRNVISWWEQERNEPLYITHKKNAIYCENCIPNTQSKFVFETIKSKTEYINKFCSVNQGKKCLHYRAMMILYERGMLNGNS